MHQSGEGGGGIKPVLSQISLHFSIIHPFQLLIGRFQNISNKALSKNRMLGCFKWNKY